MQLSNRINNITMGCSDGWDVFLRARRMIAAGQDVIELTIGEHDIRTDPTILAAMNQSAVGGNTGYALVPGNQNLREAVAARIQSRTGTPTSWRNIMITPGGQSALFSAHMATLDEGDTALYCDPHYTTYPGVLRALGAKTVSIPTRSSDDFQPRTGPLNAAARGAKTLLINSPNNPTGVVYSRETMQNIAQTCKDHDLWLISDEVYDTQVWRGSHTSPRSLPDLAERTIVIGSMSKSHAMTGSRIGWLVAPEAVIQRTCDLATVVTYGVAGFVQDAALFALKQGEALETKVAAPFARRRKLALDVLKDTNAVRMIPASGAMYLMLDIRATGLSGDDFANALLDTEKIAVMPGESFGTCAAGHVRVAMTIDDARFEAALRRLAGFAQSQIDT